MNYTDKVDGKVKTHAQIMRDVLRDEAEHHAKRLGITYAELMELRRQRRAQRAK